MRKEVGEISHLHYFSDYPMKILTIAVVDINFSLKAAAVKYL